MGYRGLRDIHQFPLHFLGRIGLRFVGVGFAGSCAIAAFAQPGHDHLEKGYGSKRQQNQYIFQTHRGPPVCGPGGGPSVPAMASRIAVSACTFFIR